MRKTATMATALERSDESGPDTPRPEEPIQPDPSPPPDPRDPPPYPRYEDVPPTRPIDIELPGSKGRS
jgi:hypothetical protein